MSFFTDQTDTNLKASLHSAEYQTLLGLLFEGQTSKFVCLKPICNSYNRELECRKREVLQSVLLRISSLVSGGMELEDAIDSIPDYCNCETPACECFDDTEYLSGGGSGR
jgi:hypothetical protein